jgi:hypothetical protein
MGYIAPWPTTMLQIELVLLQICIKGESSLLLSVDHVVNAIIIRIDTTMRHIHLRDLV